LHSDDNTIKGCVSEKSRSDDLEGSGKMGSLAVEAPRFGKGKGSGAKEDSSPASALIIS
jgi:hypothetical protein